VNALKFTQVSDKVAFCHHFFMAVMDWILRTSMKDRVGIEWIDEEKLSVLDFADDFVLLENRRI